jgi:hypothetical protein
MHAGRVRAHARSSDFMMAMRKTAFAVTSLCTEVAESMAQHRVKLAVRPVQAWAAPGGRSERATMNESWPHPEVVTDHVPRSQSRNLTSFTGILRFPGRPG